MTDTSTTVTVIVQSIASSSQLCSLNHIGEIAFCLEVDLGIP